MSFTQNIRPSWQSWVPVLLLMSIAVFIRLRLTSEHDHYVLEGDGPYYPLQVRSLAENFRLGLPDVPLLFIIERFFTWFFQIFSTYSSDDCILMGIRFSDAFLPPLAAIPVFLISRELKGPASKNNFYAYLMVAFAVLNFSPVHIFSHCLHKNAVAVVWAFYYLLFMIRFIKYSQTKHLYLALLMLALCALTHFGTFSILLLFSALAGFMWLLRNRAIRAPVHYRMILTVLICALIFILSVAVFDYARFKRLLSIPGNIFEAPLLLVAMNGEDIAGHTNIFNMLVMSFLFVFALIVLIRNRGNISPFQQTLSGTFLLFSFLMVNPLLGIEWANRLFMMAYIPITVLYLVFFNGIKTKWPRLLPATCIIGLTCLSATVGFFQKGFRSMSSEALSEFKAINRKVKFTENSLLIGNRDLRLLACWFFRTKSSADYALKKEDVKRFDSIYVIWQIKGSNFPESHYRGDNKIPTNSINVFCGEYFEIHKLLDAQHWTGGRSGIPKYKGVIESIGSNSLTILNNWTGTRRVVEFSRHTVMHLNAGDTGLKKGLSVEIYGKGRPFSLTVDAEEIFGNKYLIQDP